MTFLSFPTKGKMFLGRPLSSLRLAYLLAEYDNVATVLHKDKDNTEQENMSTVPMQKAENSERFWKRHDGCELRRGLLNGTRRQGKVAAQLLVVV
jgi:hypothetical protein